MGLCPGHWSHQRQLLLARGSVDGDTVQLSGKVLFANNPSFLDTTVTTHANFSTGAITWTFGSLAFTGTGTVIHA